jgi:hypothetical protein
MQARLKVNSVFNTGMADVFNLSVCPEDPSGNEDFGDGFFCEINLSVLKGSEAEGKLVVGEYVNISIS